MGKNNVKWEPLSDPRKKLFPLFHLKLSHIKQFVRTLDKEPSAFKYLQDFFFKLSACVFIGPQIKKDMECQEFPKKYIGQKKQRGTALSQWILASLEYRKAENYVEFAETLVTNYGKMCCKMALKVHILDYHLDKFK